MRPLSDSTTRAGLIDELTKIGFDTATAMEAIGIPAAIAMGYHHGGLRGAGISGAGAAGGLGIGMLGSHAVKGITDKSPWMRRHPLAKAIVDSAPVGMGGIVGGTAGEHFANHGPAHVKLSSALTRYLMNKINPIVALDAVNEAGKIPGRVNTYLDELKEDSRTGTY